MLNSSIFFLTQAHWMNLSNIGALFRDKHVVLTHRFECSMFLISTKVDKFLYEPLVLSCEAPPPNLSQIVWLRPSMR